MTHMLLGVNNKGYLRWAFVETPKIPDGWVQPGEVAFVVLPLDFKARPMHDPGDYD